jgi:HAD superfamily hydrolase (TIGR01509 family)
MVTFPILLSDVGGVVVEDHWAEVARELSREFPIDIGKARETLLDFCPRLDLGDETLQEFHQRFISKLDLEIPWEQFYVIVTDRGLKLIPQTFELYRQLRDKFGVRIIALSNMSEEIWGILDRRFQISLAFDGSILSGRCHVKKPDPRFFANALTQAGGAASQCIFVDDLEANVRGARSVGITSFRVSGNPMELRQLLNGFFPGVQPPAK